MICASRAQQRSATRSLAAAVVNQRDKPGWAEGRTHRAPYELRPVGSALLRGGGVSGIPQRPRPLGAGVDSDPMWGRTRTRRAWAIGIAAFVAGTAIIASVILGGRNESTADNGTATGFLVGTRIVGVPNGPRSSPNRVGADDARTRQEYEHPGRVLPIRGPTLRASTTGPWSLSELPRPQSLTTGAALQGTCTDRFS